MFITSFVVVNDKDIKNDSPHCPIVADDPHIAVTHIIIILLSWNL